VDSFEVLAAPQRRRILAALVRADSNVNQLAAALELAQPAISKHLKVLRDARFVSVRGDGQQRIYQLQAAPFHELDAWLEPYRRLWTQHLDALEQHLDRLARKTSPARKEKRHERKQIRTQPARRRQRPARS
jgi:DNA-binding transcriptional ArsR family regulator